MLSLSDSAQVHRWAKQRSVQITLSLVDDKFELEWRERGGPKLTEAPTHEGFGTNLLRRVVADQFKGEVVYEWNPDGLILRLIAPSNHLIEVTRGLESEADLEGNHDRGTEKMEKPSRSATRRHPA